jgi:hypothetical protein
MSYEYIYFCVEKPYSGNVKIGRTSDIKSRLSKLQTGNPNELVMFNKIMCKTVLNVELLIHKYLKGIGKHIRLEWFNLTISELDVLIKKYKPYEIDKDMQNAIEELVEANYALRKELNRTKQLLSKTQKPEEHEKPKQELAEPVEESEGEPVEKSGEEPVEESGEESGEEPVEEKKPKEESGYSDKFACMYCGKKHRDSFNLRSHLRNNSICAAKLIEN